MLKGINQDNKLHSWTSIWNKVEKSSKVGQH